MNSLVVKWHHQNIQMRSQNLMLKQVISFVGVNALLHIIDVTDISYLPRISITSTSNITYTPKYELLRRNLLPEEEGKKNGSIKEIFDVAYYNCGLESSIRETEVRANISFLV